MTSKLERFFTPDNFNDNFHNVCKNDLKHYIDVLNALSKVSNETIYLVDYSEKKFLYVSHNPIFLCGYSPEAVAEMGYSFYEKIVPEEELELLIKINDAGFSFFKKIPLKEKPNYSIYYDFHIKQPAGNLILIHHKLTPLFINEKAQISLALCSVSYSPKKTFGNVFIRNDKENKNYEYNNKKDKWTLIENISFKDKEKDILLLAIQGYTSKEIAQKIHYSIDKVKFDKKNIFRKLNVDNITEATAFAITHKLFS